MLVQLYQPFSLKYSIRTRENHQLLKFIEYMFNVITLYVLLSDKQTLFCFCFLTYIFWLILDSRAMLIHQWSKERITSCYFTTLHSSISRKGSLIKKYNKIHEYRCSMLYHIPNVLPLHIKGQFLEDSSLFLNLLSRETVGFDSGELSDVVSLFWLDCEVPATGGTVVGVLLDDVQKKSVIRRFLESLMFVSLCRLHRRISS